MSGGLAALDIDLCDLGAYFCLLLFLAAYFIIMKGIK